MTIVLAKWYHLYVKPVSRRTGRSAVAAAAYRRGERLYEEEIDVTHDFRRRPGVMDKFTCAPANAPEWAHDPERLWNAAHAADNRKNSTIAREAELSLPAAISAEARERIAREFSQHLVDRYGVAVSGAIHAPSRHGDPRNYHAHILFTTRAIGPDGLGDKTRVLDQMKTTGPKEIIHLRAYACGLINAALEEAGSDERVDHRSFITRGIDAEPTQHLGPSASAMERRGEPSERGDHNREVKARNDARDALVVELGTINAVLAAERERVLHAFFGVPEPDPSPPAEEASAPVGIAPEPPAEAPVPPESLVPEIPRPPGLWGRVGRALGGLFGGATEPPAPVPGPEPPGELDHPAATSPSPVVEVASIHREPEPLAAPVPAAVSLPATPAGSSDDFAAVHNATISRAASELALLNTPDPITAENTPIMERSGPTLVPGRTDDQTFVAMHRETVHRAISDLEWSRQQEAREPGWRDASRFSWWASFQARLAIWYDHMRGRGHDHDDRLEHDR